MRAWLAIIALILIGLTWLYSQAMAGLGLRPMETFADYIPGSGVAGGPNSPNRAGNPDGIAPELATFNGPLPLADMLTPEPHLTEYGYAGVAGLDQSRETELGGQYVQRTNNYRRTYPDNGSALLFEFDGAIYRSPTDIGATVPCAGAGRC